MKFDRVIRAFSANEEYIGIAVDATETLKAAIASRGYGKEVPIKLGEILMEAGMMASMLKGDDDELTICLDSFDHATRFIATANKKIEIKAYSSSINDNVFKGPATLTVIKDLGLKVPYNSTTLASLDDFGGSMEDYFRQSEQIDTHSKLLVSFDEDNNLIRASGIFLQVLPFCDPKIKAEMEDNWDNYPSLNSLFYSSASLEEMIQILFKEGSVKTEELPIKWHCSCSKERSEAMIESLPTKEIEAMIEDNKTIYIECSFCGKSYSFTVDELKSILARKDASNKA